LILIVVIYLALFLSSAALCLALTLRVRRCAIARGWVAQPDSDRHVHTTSVPRLGGIAIFLTYLIPPTLLFIPLSRIVAILGLQDTIWSLVLVYPSFTIPFSVWLLMGFFKSIPKELEDAAMVDGLTRFGAFFRLVVPISISGILTVVIFTFTLVTQEFVYALTFISPESQQMVGVGIPIFLVRGDVYFWGSLMAACLITSLPIALLYNLFLDRFIAGFTVGAIK